MTVFDQDLDTDTRAVVDGYVCDPDEWPKMAGLASNCASPPSESPPTGIPEEGTPKKDPGLLQQSGVKSSSGGHPLHASTMLQRSRNGKQTPSDNSESANDIGDEEASHE